MLQQFVMRLAMVFAVATSFLWADATPFFNRPPPPESARYLYTVSSSGVYTPVLNETTVAVSAGFATIIGLGMLSAVNNFLKAIAEHQNATSTRTFRRAENIYKDFKDYELAMEQYEKDYQQYLKDYDEWVEKYGSERIHKR